MCALGANMTGTPLSQAACVEGKSFAGVPEPVSAQLPPGIWPRVGVVPGIPVLSAWTGSGEVSITQASSMVANSNTRALLEARTQMSVSLGELPS